MLNLRNLRVTIDDFEIINIDELTLRPGARLGLVGESGSGKTMTAKAIAGLLPNEAKVAGEVNFDGQNLLTLGDRDLAKVRGKRIGFVFQDPARSLNPMMRIGKQVSEAIRIHTNLKGQAVTDKVIDLLRQVQLPEPETLLRRYPHQLSGGQQQRVMIAAAIAADPDLLIADEPTTALDVTVQEEILRLLISLSEQRKMSLLFVSHDLGVVRFVCNQVAVIYGGNIVEAGDIDRIITVHSTATPPHSWRPIRACPRTTTSRPSSVDVCRPSRVRCRRSADFRVVAASATVANMLPRSALLPRQLPPARPITVISAGIPRKEVSRDIVHYPARFRRADVLPLPPSQDHLGWQWLDPA